MNLILIDDNILINADSIDAIELSVAHGKKILNVFVNGKEFVVTKPIELKELIKSKGIDLTKQFFAG